MNLLYKMSKMFIRLRVMTAFKATIKRCLSQPSGISLFRKKKKNMLCYIKAAVNVLWAFHSTITTERLCLRLKTSGEV